MHEVFLRLLLSSKSLEKNDDEVSVYSSVRNLGNRLRYKDTLGFGLVWAGGNG